MGNDMTGHANAAVTTKNMLNRFVLRSVSC
jgi:hypothetical protein